MRRGGSTAPAATPSKPPRCWRVISVSSQTVCSQAFPSGDLGGHVGQCPRGHRPGRLVDQVAGQRHRTGDRRAAVERGAQARSSADDGQPLQPARRGVALVPGEAVGGHGRPLGDGLRGHGPVDRGGRGLEEGRGRPAVVPRRPHEVGCRHSERLERQPVRLPESHGHDGRAVVGGDGQRLAHPRLEVPLAEIAPVELDSGAQRPDLGAAEHGHPEDGDVGGDAIGQVESDGHRGRLRRRRRHSGSIWPGRKRWSPRQVMTTSAALGSIGDRPGRTMMVTAAGHDSAAGTRLRRSRRSTSRAR